MAELEALANAAGGYALLMRVLGYCGLRWGQAVVDGSPSAIGRQGTG